MLGDLVFGMRLRTAHFSYSRLHVYSKFIHFAKSHCQSQPFLKLDCRTMAGEKFDLLGISLEKKRNSRELLLIDLVYLCDSPKRMAHVEW